MDQHLERVLAAVTPLPIETCPLREAHGRRLASEISARLSVPAWDNSAMDGYAVRFVDIENASPTHPVTLRIVGDVPAGSQADPKIGNGETVRIMTGAPIPSDADTIVPLELTNRDEPLADLAQDVTILESLILGKHVRKAGEDVAPGTDIAHRGQKLHAALVAAIASAGHSNVEVHARPRVAVIATGSELVEPGSELLRGQIPDSNSYLVSALATEIGAEVVDVRYVDDDPENLVDVLSQLEPHVDVFILTGGVSQGAYDPVTRAFGDETDVRFTKVAMQPGKPQAFGRFKNAILFGLPGNPVSVWVSFQVFVRPALLKMQGVPADSLIRVRMSAKAGRDWKSPIDREQYLPANITWHDGQWRVEPVAALGSASHLTTNLAKANGYAIVAVGIDQVKANDTIEIIYDFEGMR